MDAPARTPLLKTNLDTNLLKIIAIISMTIDHAGGILFPQYAVCRWIGRLAFPIFCYCMTVGLLYTHSIKRYLARLGIFALVSQPFYALAFHPDEFLKNLINPNIFFTLFISLLAVWGFKERKWLVFIAATLFISFVNFDYSATGIILMMIFYLCRNKPLLGAGLYILSYVPAFFNGELDDPLSLVIGGYAIDFEVFAIAAVLPIFIKTATNIKIPKWFFYCYYPAHLLAIFIIRAAMHI